MKSRTLFFLIALLVFPSLLSAEEFLGAPIVPQGKIVKKTNSKLEVLTKMTHDEVIEFYKKALEEYSDIKFREWKDSTYIEDDGKLAWHSVTVSKEYKGGTTSVIIAKDNWTWIIGTLILRYVGVFIVLLILFLGMNVSGKIISGTIRRMELKKTGS